MLRWIWDMGIREILRFALVSLHDDSLLQEEIVCRHGSNPCGCCGRGHAETEH